MACVGCEGKPAPENNPCAVCGLTAPSNANTSGLEVVAWDSDVLDTFSGFSSNVLTRKPHVAKTGERVRSQAALVTAASAQSKISGLQREVAVAVAAADHMADRATAAEARADRLAKALRWIVSRRQTCASDEVEVWELQDHARAALQQETQP